MERHIFDENQPTGSMSLMNLRNILRALFQGDFMPLRARASMVLDDMEYSTDAQAQAKWSGTGVTVTKTTTKQEGNYALQCVIDATGNRKVSKTQSLNLSAFKRVKIWERCSVVSSAFQFYLRDSAGNESYWNLTSNAVANTFQQDDLDITTPSSSAPAAANLASITEWGFLGMDASATYILDTVKVIAGKNVAVEPGLIASFYQQVYVGQSRISFAGGSSPAITNPAANPRIDLLVMDSSGTLSWITGTEATSPSEPTFPTDKIPICLVYCKVTMAKVVDYEDKDANPNEAYIYKDVRPLLNLALNTFLQLTDTPSSYSGQANKAVVVKSTEDGLSFGSIGNKAAKVTKADADFSTSSTNPVAITGLSVSITLDVASNIFAWIVTRVKNTNAGAENRTYIYIGGSAMGATHFTTCAAAATRYGVTTFAQQNGQAAGTYTIEGRADVSAGTGTWEVTMELGVIAIPA